MRWIKTQLAVWRHFSVTVLVSSLFGAFGVLWLCVEIGSFFSPELAAVLQSLWWVFLLSGVLLGFLRAWPRTFVRARVSNTDTWVEIRVCDFFSVKGGLVIGSNTTFDTSIEDGTISEDSVQGQFTRRVVHSVAELDNQIAASLAETHFESRADNKQYGKVSEYPIGTVASVTFSGVRSYLVAIASLNSGRVASTSRERVLGALPFLWEFIRSSGTFEPLCCPILGSGFSRLNTPREELVREITKSFVASTRVGRFCEHLTIVISPEDFRQHRIDLPALGRFLEHECTYTGGSGRGDDLPTGTPAAPLGDEPTSLPATEERVRGVLREELDNELQRLVEESRSWVCSNSECPNKGQSRSGLGPSPRCSQCEQPLGEIVA